jgi:Tol biopolymer transport system component
VNQSNPAVRCTKCGAANRSGARYCNNCGQPLPQPRAAAKKQEPRSSSNRWLLWVGGAVVSLLLLGVCGAGGWIVYQKLTESQTTLPQAQGTPAEMPATIIPGELAATVTPDAPTAMPTEVPASGYIFFASGTFSSGAPWDDDFVEGSWDLYVADTNGNNRNLLTHTTDDWTEGEFAPNGRWLWFEIDEINIVGDEYIDTRTVYAANADGSGLRKVYVPYDGYLDIFEFSKDGWAMYFREIRDSDSDDPSDRYNHIVYNHRNGLIVDSGGYQVTAISSDSRWALLRKDNQTSTGSYESEEWSLVNMDTGQWENFGRFKYAGFEFSPDEKNLIFNSHDDDPGYKIYNIASESWTTINFRGKDWLQFLPDGIHIFFEQDGMLYLINNMTNERSEYLSDYRAHAVDLQRHLLFTEQMPSTTDKVLINAYRDARGVKPDIYVVNGDGSNLRLVAQDAYVAFLGDYQHVLLARTIPDYSDDEEAFCSYSIIDLRSNEEFPLSAWYCDNDTLPLELSPDGIHMLWHECQLIPAEYGGNRVEWSTYKLWILDLDKMESQQLELEGVNWDTYYANFSSDGSKIVYGVFEFADDGWSLSNYATYVTNLDGSSVKLIGEKTFPIMFEHPLRD